MKSESINILDISTQIPTVQYDLSVENLRKLFKELQIYDYMVVIIGEKPIGLVYRDKVMKSTNKNLIAGDIARIKTRLRVLSLNEDSLPDLLDILPIRKEHIIVVDKKGHYIGVLNYEVLIHYIISKKDKKLPIIQQIKSSFGKEHYLIIFGLKNIKPFRERYGMSKEEGIYKLLYEDIADFYNLDVSCTPESGEMWVYSSEPPRKSDIKEIIKEFHKEFSLLYGDIEPINVYGMSLDLSLVKSQEDFENTLKELRSRAKRIEGSVFIIHGERPMLILIEPKDFKIIKTIKVKILDDFDNIVSAVKKVPKDMWEHILYDIFKEYSYFELFYIINERGLQISNNIINPKVNYFVMTGRKGSDRAERPYYEKTIEYGSYISDIYLSQATDDFCITVAKRFTYNGKTYILAGDINFKEIHKLVKAYTTAQT